MSCNIQLNTNGKILSVNADNGEKSLLFATLSSLPFLSKEQAAELYLLAKKQATKNTIKDVNGEPQIVFQPLGGEHEYLLTDKMVTYTDFYKALSLDASERGVRFGILTAKNVEEFNPTNSLEHKKLVEIAKKADSTKTTISTNNTYISDNPKDFILVDKFDRATNTNSKDGFLASLINLGIKIKPKQKVVEPQFQIIGEQGAKALDSKEEVTYRMDNLNVARQMEEAGKTAKEIRLATGWEKHNSLWKYEILDGKLTDKSKGVKVNKESLTGTITEEILLPDLYDNSELYHAYPLLKDKIVKVIEPRNPSFNNLYGYVHEGEIYINKKNYGDITARQISHEISHVLQSIEGFGAGSNPNWYRSSLTYISNKVKSGESKIFREEGSSELDSSGNGESEAVQFFKSLGLTNDEIETAFKVLSEEDIDNAAYEMYRRTGGEVEARNVEKRLNMSLEERQNTLLSETEDVDREDQILLRNALGTQASTNNSQELLEGVYEQLKKAKVVDNTYFLSNQQIEDKLRELGYSEDIVKQVSAWHNINKYTVEDNLEDTSTITLSFDKGNVTIGEVYGLYDFLEEFEDNFTDSDFFIEIQDLNIAPNFQGKGEGSKLLKDTITYIQQIFGNVDIYLNASPIGNRSLNAQELSEFYSQEGFRILENEGSNITMLRKGGEVQFQKTGKQLKVTTNGCLVKENGQDNAYINLESKNPTETLLHEHSHGFLNKLKQSNPEVYKKGLDLVKEEIKKGKQKEKLSKKDTKELKKLLDFKTDSVTIYDENATAEILIEQLSDGEVSLYISEIWSDIKGQGSATKLLNKIQSFSDEYNVAISLRASTNNNIRTSGGLEQEALVKWYEKNSFYISEEDNNFEKDETAPFMVYQPTIAVKSEIQDIIDFVKTNQPNLEEGTEAFANEVLAEISGRKAFELLSSKEDSNIKTWLNEFFDYIRNLLGLTDYTNEQVAQMSLEDYATAVGISLMQGKELFVGDKAQEYFTREADRLPLTLAVFSNSSFKELQGKQVNPTTIQQLLNQSGIKQIEKDLIKQVIEDNYKGQKRIDYDEFEATVRANIMPLERIFTSSYATYGMDNLGDGDYGTANTIILNAPIEHGVTGHFSGDFKASGRANIKYVPKQLNDNVWVAVEEGYEANANDNNIYQYVGTAGTKEAVDAWIDNYENPTGLIGVYDGSLTQNVPINEGMFGHIRVWEKRELNVSSDYFESEEYLIKKWMDAQTIYDKNNTEENLQKLKTAKEKALSSDKNKKTNNSIFYVAELQSDYFQKQNARKELIESSQSYKYVNDKYNAKNAEIEKEYDGFKYLQKMQDEWLSYLEKLPNVNIKLEEDGYLRIFVNGEQIATSKYKPKSEVEIQSAKREFLRDSLVEYYPKEFNNKRNSDLVKYQDFLNEKEKKKNDNEKSLSKAKDEVYQNLPKDQKQFIASQKIWEQRMVREAVKEASLSGATSLRFPTPYTLSVIEGYLSEGAPYEIENANDSNSLEAGDRIYYAGEDYTVVDSDSTTITIAESGRVSSSLDEDIISQEVDNSVDNDMYEIENNLKDFYTQEEWNDFRDNYSSISSTELDEVGNEIEEGVFEVLEGKIRDIVTEYYKGIFTDAEYIIRDMYGSDVWISGNTVTWTDGTANVETLMQPSEYKGQGTKDSFSIEDDLDETQQTVAHKYEEIAQILKSERGEENVEIVTDDNGFDWYSTKILAEETQSPVVAFQQIKAPETESVPTLSMERIVEELILTGEVTRSCRM